MAWEVEKGADGRPIWRGQDAIFDPHRKQEDREKTGALGVHLIGAIIGGALGAAALGAGGLLLGPFIGVGIAAMMTRKTTPYDNFDTRPWSLSDEGDNLLYFDAEKSEYLNAISWAVPVENIASVEAGRTIDWRPSREYGAYFGVRKSAVPDVEWQTFLVLTDQTRRVIYTANADREGCGSLAASIRAHVEAARGASAPALSTPAAPAGDGFDL